MSDLGGNYGWPPSYYNEARKETERIANNLIAQRIGHMALDNEFDVNVDRDPYRLEVCVAVHHRPSNRTLKARVDPMLEQTRGHTQVVHETVIRLKRELLAHANEERGMDRATAEKIETMRVTNARLQNDLKQANDRIANGERELLKYKSVCKQLTVALERARLGEDGGAVEGAIRAAALEQAAEYLMDHGVVSTGAELEQICQEIAELPPREECSDIPH